MLQSSKFVAALAVAAFVLSFVVVSSGWAGGSALRSAPAVSCMPAADERAESDGGRVRVIRGVAEPSEEGEGSGGGWLGVHIQDLTAELREVLDLDEDTEGALVAEVNDDGPAEKAGIKKGDVIVLMDRREIDSIDELLRLVKKKDPGDEVTIVVLRDGAKKKLVATLGKRPKKLREEIEFNLPHEYFKDKDAYVYKFPREGEALTLKLKKGHLGVKVIDVSEGLGEYFDTETGALVLEVVEDSGAEEAGIKPGDVIIEADGKPVEDSEDLTRLLQKHEKGDSVELVLVRKGKKMKLDAVLGEGPAWAWIEGMNKGIVTPEMPHLYFEKTPEGLEEGVELHMKMEALSREMEKLQEELEELSEELEELRE